MNEYPSFRSRSTAVSCQVPNCDRPNVPDTDMCTLHHERFPRVLLDLANMWGDLETALYRRSSSQANTKVKSSSLVDLSSSWNPHATEVMSQLAEWTDFLVRIVWNEHPPTFARMEFDFARIQGGALRTPVALAKLARHFGRWLSSYPGQPPLGPDLLRAAQALRADGLRAIQSEPVRRVGYKGLMCSETIGGDEFQDLFCDSPMAVILDQNGNPGLLVCFRHPKTHYQYQHDEWMQFAKERFSDAG